MILFAVVAAVLIGRLRSVLGTRHGDERQRPNPLEQAKQQTQKDSLNAPARAPIDIPKLDKVNQAHTMVISDDFLKPDGVSIDTIKKNLTAIAVADHQFNLEDFLQGAKMAFEMITDSFAKADRDILKPLLSEDLYAAFEGVISDREDKQQTSHYELHRIKDARIADAKLGGVMAYVTVDFDIEQTSTLTDKDGEVIDGNPDKISETHDVWTFSRDIRSPDPNWELVATRLGDG